MSIAVEGKTARKVRAGEEGSVLVLVALSLTVMLGMAGLAIDIGQMYVTKQKAQAAADAAAEAGALDIYNGTNTGSNAFGSASVTCPSSGGITPCRYAALNGFGSANSDTITVDFSPQTPSVPTCVAPGVTLSSSDATQLICVTVSRVVNTSFMRLLGTSATTVSATSIAAISTVSGLAPIMVLHPTLAGSFSTNGGNTVTICGGPVRSIQVNSTSSGSVSVKGSGTVDLSHAGPLDSGNCSAGTGGNFANAGAESPYPGNLLLGTKPGVYVEPASIVKDPLLSVAAPAQPVALGSSVTYSTAAAESAHSCPTACTVYSPGYYANGINPSGFSVFRPGIYWINHGGFNLGSNTIVRMAQAAIDQSDPTGLTSWTDAMLIYNSPSTPVNSKSDIFSVNANSGKVSGKTYPTADCPNGGSCLNGSPSSSTYQNILFFQNHATATSLTHSFGGGGSLTLSGVLYATHTTASIKNDSSYQSIALSGNSGNQTIVQGAIITDALSVGGNAGITMNLSGDAYHTFRVVALAQ